MRRVLKWFLGLGLKGVESNIPDLSAAKRRVVKELGLSGKDADAVLADLKKRGFIETVDDPRFSQLYYTRISNAGRRFLAGRRASTTVNIQGGAVGAIQTGPGATAQVGIQVNPPFSELVSGLDELRKILSSQADHKDAVALVDRAKAVASSANPNKTVIESLLASPPTVIQTTASLQPAYQLLKSAAQQIGINLP